MPYWVIDKAHAIELLKGGGRLDEWTTGVRGYTYNIGANTVRIETAQKLIKDGKVAALTVQPYPSVTIYAWVVK